jgi:hypothetical protein
MKAANGAIPINPLDTIYSKTSFSYAGANGTASFFLEDVTTGQSASFQKTGNNDAVLYYNGQSADFVSESPDRNFLPFSEFAWVNSTWTDSAGTAHAISDDPYGAIYQLTVTNHILTGPLSSNGENFASGFGSC